MKFHLCPLFQQQTIISQLVRKPFLNIFGIGFEKIYEGNNNNFNAVGLKQKTFYTFKLKIMENNEQIDEYKFEVETLLAPSALLSEDSLDIANGKIIEKYKKLANKEI